ncbi:MAG: helix-turn-helix domain-containing protein [Oxalobacter formigenes]|nr:helix-turn-helix domain-containing protein [Oxalobacter formigenes]
MDSDDMKKEENDTSEAGVSVPVQEQDKQDEFLAVATGAQGVTDTDAGTGMAVSEETQTPQQQEKEVLKPGAQLAAFRVAAGIEQEQVAASLKMTIRQVRELEADHYEALHGVAISRGFVRAYAKMLQVDPEPLVAMFAKDDPVTASRQLDQLPRRDASAPFMQGSQPFGKKRGMGRTIWLILIVIAVVLAAGYGLKRFVPGKKTEPVAETGGQVAAQVVPPEKSTPEIVVPDPEKTLQATDKTGNEKALPDEEKSVQAGGDQAAKEDGEIVKAAVQEGKQEQRQDKDEPIQSQPEKAPASADVPGNLLTVRFSGPSKVQVLKADAAVLQEFDGKAGDVHQLEIGEPVTLVVEEAVNVRAEFRQQPLVLRTARRSPEARIELK